MLRNVNPERRRGNSLADFRDGIRAAGGVEPFRHRHRVHARALREHPAHGVERLPACFVREVFARHPVFQNGRDAVRRIVEQRGQ